MLELNTLESVRFHKDSRQVSYLQADNEEDRIFRSLKTENRRNKKHKNISVRFPPGEIFSTHFSWFMAPQK